MQIKSRILILVLTSSVLPAINSVCLGESASTTSNQKPNRQEMIALQQKLADLHLKAVACLRTSKTLEQCRQEMMEGCTTHFDGNCPMMGGAPIKMGNRGRGMMNWGGMGWMMMDDIGETGESKSPDKPGK